MVLNGFRRTVPALERISVELSDSLVLTHAEIEFLLQWRPPEHIAIRELLDLAFDERREDAVKTGLASLLARGLCVPDGDGVEASATLRPVVTGFTTARIGTRACGRADSRNLLVHILYGPDGSLALFPAGPDRFTVAALDQKVAFVDQITRFVDSCQTAKERSTVVIQAITRADRVGIALMTDESGAWFVSDSEESPDRATPSTRRQAMRRIRELLPS